MNGRFGNQSGLGDVMKSFFASKSALNILVYSNVAVWLIVMLASLVIWLFKIDDTNWIVQYLAVPASLPALGRMPWSVLTYMFLHKGFWHLFFNMWMLYFGGYLFVKFMSGRQLVWTYLLGGIMGAAFFILAYNIFPVFEESKDYAVAMGASASVLAVLVAVATYKPDHKMNLLFLGNVKLVWLALVFVIVDVLSIEHGNPGGHIAHLGGALWGFIYAFLLRKGFDVLKIFNRQGKIRPTRFKVIKEKKTKKSKAQPSERPVSDEEYNRQRAQNEHDIDVILDKIAKSGYSSLTSDEKAFLFKNSGK